jgi:CheY-like chemotaxis protein
VKVVVKVKILIVDDDSEIHKLIPAMLGSEHFHFEFAYQTQDAIEKFETVVPNLVLLDINMPGANGFVALRRLRGIASQQNPDCKIVMMTRSKSREDVQTALSYGAADYIAKPVAHRTLKEKVRSLFPDLNQATLPDFKPEPDPESNSGPDLEPVPGAEIASEQATAVSQRSILIVDDEEDMRALLQAHLKDTGHELAFASSAARAFEVLLTLDRVDLILLDLNLGDANGIDFLTQLRSKQYRDYARDFVEQTHRLDAIQNTPVLVLTGSRNPEHVARLRSLSIAGYLVKPFEKPALLAKIGSIL